MCWNFNSCFFMLQTCVGFFLNCFFKARENFSKADVIEHVMNKIEFHAKIYEKGNGIRNT